LVSRKWPETITKVLTKRLALLRAARACHLCADKIPDPNTASGLGLGKRLPNHYAGMLSANKTTACNDIHIS